MTSRRTPALALLGHGSRSDDGVAAFEAFTDLVRTSMERAGHGDADFEAGFLELAEPAFDTALDSLVARGADHVVVVPVVLLAAGHLKNDGPTLMHEARLRHPETTFTYARDIGVHPVTVGLAARRIAETVERWKCVPAPDPSGSAPPSPAEAGASRPDVRCNIGSDGLAAVVVGRGSTDPDANSDLYKIARLLSDGRGLPLVEPAFVSLAPPSVTDTLDRMACLGARRIAVVPYFLFPGILTQRIAEQASLWSDRHPGIAVGHGAAMGPDPLLADLVVERFADAASGPVAMNCDFCVYRTELPGYEHRAGSLHPARHRGH